MSRRIAAWAAAAASFVAAAPGAAAPIVTIDGPPDATPQNRPAITGAGATGPTVTPVTVELFQGPAVKAAPDLTLTVPIGPNGRYEAIPGVDLSEGAWTARASQGDETGSATTEPLGFVVDTVKPVEPTITAPGLGSALPTPVVTITGRAGTAPGDGATVRLFFTGPAGEFTLTAPIGADGSFSATTPTLADGSYGVSGAQQDLAGNGSSGKESGFSIDTKAPNTTIDAGPVPVAGDPRDVRVTFGASELSTYRCELDGGPARECEPPVLVLRDLKKGRHELVITAVDPAGNADPTPARVRFGVETARPRVSVVAPGALVARGGEARFRLRCPGGRASGRCTGQVTLRRNGRSLLREPARFSLGAGKATRLSLFLNDRGQTLLFRNGRVTVQLVIVAADGRGNVGRRTIRRTLTLPG